MPVHCYPCTSYLLLVGANVCCLQTGQTMRLRPKVRPQQQPNAGPQQSASVYNSGYGVGGSHGHMGHEDAAAADPQQHARAGVYSVAISTNGNVVAAGSSDSIIRLWDTRTQEKVSAEAKQAVCLQEFRHVTTCPTYLPTLCRLPSCEGIQTMSGHCC
jgi:hypothetical protein